jgi:hypothetical protein
MLSRFCRIIRLVLRLFGIIAIAFNVWMLVDAYRRRAETYWLWIILGVPGGSLAYLFLVKLRDRDVQALGRRLLASFERPPPPELLRERYEDSPSFANRLALAQGLADAGQHAESITHFEALLATRPDDADALYGRAVCELDLGDAAAAVLTLERLIDLVPSYREYAAWAELADALQRQGKSNESLEALRSLVSHTPRMPHQILLARQLVRMGKVAEATALLERALREHDRSPRYVRRNDRGWAREARRMIAENAERNAA